MTDRVPSVDDALDQGRDGTVGFRHPIMGGCIGMTSRSIRQNSDDFVFRQNPAVVQGQQKGFSNGQRRKAGHVRRVLHSGQLFSEE